MEGEKTIMTKSGLFSKKIKRPRRRRNPNTVAIGKVFAQGGKSLFKSAAKLGRGIDVSKSRKRAKTEKAARFIERR